jgi:Restriction Enzyme Adenine Methylase Associated
MNLNELISSGKLKAGEELRWTRRSLKVVHIAKLLTDGRIQTADGVIHKTPSGAAKHLNGGKPVDGWLAWKLSNGKSLGSLR